MPDGHRLAAFGAAPPELGGWEANPVATDVRRRLAELFAAKAKLHPDLVVLTGLRLGAEMLAAEAAARRRRRPTWRCCPTPSRPTVVRGEPPPVRASWSPRPGPWSRSRRSARRAGPDFRNALARRDGWLAANVHEAVLVWDGDDRSLAELHRKLVKRLGEEEVWVIAP